MKTFGIAFLFLFLFSSAFSQVLQPDGQGPRAYIKTNVKTMKPIELSHLREADVFWSKRVWREIDLRQKINYPLYYPVEQIYHGKRSLFQIIYDEFVLDSLKKGPNAVKFYYDYFLTSEMKREDVYNLLSKSVDTKKVDFNNNCIVSDTTIRLEFTDAKKFVQKVRILEDWFFDKQRSVMDVRILAIGFVVPVFEIDIQPDNGPCQSGELVFNGLKNAGQPVSYSEFWMFFPQIRPVLAANECFQRSNDAMRLSYDDVFLQRIFGSYITQEENVYNRAISEYTSNLDALLEAERIKQEIFNFEQDLWEY